MYDCLVLIQAFNSPELEILGIGTVFGNTDHDTAAAIAHRSVTILALGPLTNVATFLGNYPELRREIVLVIAVAGRRRGQRFQPSPLLPVLLGDSNFEADPWCFDLVLRSGVPITFIPYEVAAKVTLNRQDLEDFLAGPPASQWVSEQASGWLQLWC